MTVTSVSSTTTTIAASTPQPRVTTQAPVAAQPVAPNRTQQLQSIQKAAEPVSTTRQTQVQAQAQVQAIPQPSVNTSGQTIGTTINITA